jgi:chorismate-pyruvate lyase
MAAPVARLPPLLRVVLISDGNLTEMLQAAFLEPIMLTKLQNKASRTRQEIKELQLSTGSKIVSRQVKLSGSHSRHLYVYAETVPAADRIPSEFLSELQNTEKPLGYLLRESHLCDHKELLSAEWVPGKTEGPIYAASINRRYTVVHKRLPIALISEHSSPCGEILFLCLMSVSSQGKY